jgi:hypothetical protein
MCRNGKSKKLFQKNKKYIIVLTKSSVGSKTHLGTGDQKYKGSVFHGNIQFQAHTHHFHTYLNPSSTHLPLSDCYNTPKKDETEVCTFRLCRVEDPNPKAIQMIIETSWEHKCPDGPNGKALFHVFQTPKTL